MDWLYSLFLGNGIAHSVLTFALVITFGILLGKVKIKGVSLGITWILFVGIIASHFGMTVDPEVRNFVQEFGLILFVFSIGLQVGPGFFSSFKHGGVTLVSCATAIVLLGVLTAYIIHVVTGTPIPTMVGILSGAVTNTPGLGAAQQAYADATGVSDPTVALGYAVAYPLGVVGIILTMIFIRYALHVKFEKEDEALAALSHEQKYAQKVSVEFTNTLLDGRTIEYVRDLIHRQFVISRVKHPDGGITMADADTVIHTGDTLWVICQSEDEEAIVAFLGHRVELSDEDWGNNTPNAELISRRILITKSSINGKKFSDLRLRTRYGITITRVNRAGMDLIPYQGLELQVGDRVMVVGPAAAVAKVADVLGNSLKKLDHPNLITIFVGIALGVLLGSIPLMNVPQPVKLGLAGGPLIVAILIGRFGTHFHLVTYTTASANLMLREIGIALFLAAVGIGAGDGFVEAVVGGGYRWIGYGFIITVVPLLIVSLVARLYLKMNYYTLMGLIAGSTTDPPALAYANATAGNDMPAVGYSTVYPVVMFLRVLTAQIFILFAL
ncbi:MAG TPA: putative transporter [Candidatus Alistipes faecavium]|uniref:putative transporter n=1 Tax=uncultured Alistipes sp. TaxID=538949 RepID=UPI001F85116F|nr:putative transporter [uncultured Alistipes sp.]HJA96535.1 putative transporter [Candidatus Alistipes faecavium]